MLRSNENMFEVLKTASNGSLKLSYSQIEKLIRNILPSLKDKYSKLDFYHILIAKLDFNYSDSWKWLEHHDELLQFESLFFDLEQNPTTPLKFWKNYLHSSNRTLRQLAQDKLNALQELLGGGAPSGVIINQQNTKENGQEEDSNAEDEGDSSDLNIPSDVSADTDSEEEKDSAESSPPKRKLTFIELKKFVKQALQEYLRKESTMKITQKQLKETIKKLALKEEKDSESVFFQKSGQLSTFGSDVDGLLSKTMEEIDKLVEAGEDLLKTDFFQHPNVGERNRFVLQRIGMLKAIKAQLATAFEASHKNF